MTSSSRGSPDRFSLARVLWVLVPIAAALAGGLVYFRSKVQSSAREHLQSDILSTMLAATGGPAVGPAFEDADGNLVNDFPPDDACVSPAVIRFSFVASPEGEEEALAWADLVKAIGESTGRPAEFVAYESIAEQLAALASGELHVTGFNTGAVPLAVATSGFVPVCVSGRADGSFGQTMKLIAPAGGRIRTLEDVRRLASGGKGGEGKARVIFTGPGSNSGFKAAVVLLLGMKLIPERDYDWSFSYDHEASIRAIAAKEADLAPVASDMLALAIDAGTIRADDVVTVFESEKFPPAALGFAFNLEPDLRAAITRTLLDFDWTGTSLEKAFGGSGSVKFVPVDYKDDWANIRRIDAAVLDAKSRMQTLIKQPRR